MGEPTSSPHQASCTSVRVACMKLAARLARCLAHSYSLICMFWASICIRGTTWHSYKIDLKVRCARAHIQNSSARHSAWSRRSCQILEIVFWATESLQQSIRAWMGIEHCWAVTSRWTEYSRKASLNENDGTGYDVLQWICENNIEPKPSTEKTRETNGSSTPKSLSRESWRYAVSLSREWRTYIEGE